MSPRNKSAFGSATASFMALIRGCSELTISRAIRAAFCSALSTIRKSQNRPKHLLDLGLAVEMPHRLLEKLPSDQASRPCRGRMALLCANRAAARMQCRLLHIFFADRTAIFRSFWPSCFEVSQPGLHRLYQTELYTQNYLGDFGLSTSASRWTAIYPSILIPLVHVALSAHAQCRHVALNAHAQCRGRGGSYEKG